MISALYIIGGLIVIVTAVLGIMTGTFNGFISSVAGGFITAMIFFALGKVLENQEDIINRLERKEQADRVSFRKVKKHCSRCKKQFDSDMNSCPHCGFRE